MAQTVLAVLWGVHVSVPGVQPTSASLVAIFLCAVGSPMPVPKHRSTKIEHILPIENGIKDSLFQNWPSFRKCSGLKESGVSHSSLSNITEVRFTRKVVP